MVEILSEILFIDVNTILAHGSHSYSRVSITLSELERQAYCRNQWIWIQILMWPYNTEENEYLS